MAGAGYSGTPLARKLGVGESARVGLIGAPEGFAAVLKAPAGTRVLTRLGGDLDVVLFFTTSRADLERRLPALQAALHPAGGLWTAWPKRASGVSSDLDENGLREIVLPTGWVDNKVCAIDETWSGLCFVMRRANRPYNYLRGAGRGSDGSRERRTRPGGNPSPL